MVIDKFPSGTVTPPPSKSLSHRALICAFLAGGVSAVHNLGESEDIAATRLCLDAMGGGKIMDCGESGSTLRFLMPIAAAFGGGRFTGHGRLLDRPLDAYRGILDFRREGDIITVDAGIRGKKIGGDVSSQFLSGLLLAAPIAGIKKIRLGTKLESAGYVDLTVDVMQKFGVSVSENYEISGNYTAAEYTVEADYSQAAYFLGAKLLGCDVTVAGLNPRSRQGDRAIVDIIAALKNGAITLDAREIPDLVPPIAVLCACADGESRITNAARLRVKECDRLKAVATELTNLGAEIFEESDGLRIVGKQKLAGGKCDAWNDHRIAMSMALAAIKCENPVELSGSKSVRKSYPNFWEDWCKSERVER